MITLATTDYGFLGFEGNELFVRSLNNDPPKVRLEAPAGSLHKGLVTFGTQRQDGRFEELVLFSGKQDERYRNDPYNFTGEITISLRKHDPALPDDQQFHEVALLRHDGITLYRPVLDQATPSFLRSPGGRYETPLQPDGNLVVYDMSTGKPIWSWMTGRL